MLGDALFCSLSRDAPGWNRRLAAPHWLATARAVADIPAVLETACRRARDGEWIVLALAYEAAPAFDAVLSCHDAAPGTPLCFAAAYAAPSPGPASLPASGRPFATTPWRPLVDREHYRRALADIREAIRQGEAYQVNYTVPLASRFTGDPAAYFAALARKQGAGYCCHLDLGSRHLLSFSPELFFSRRGDTVVSQPMKGTMPRGETPEADAALAAALAACPKNRAENRMITDLLRNDLGRIAIPGGVTVPELFAVQRLGTAWQMTSTIAAELLPGTGLEQILAALFPCGSITGAPKRSAMDIIRRLEPHPRGFYTGAIGLIAPGGDCTFSVAIRTVDLDVQSGACRFGVGGGITYDSDARDEDEECRIKAAFLDRACAPPAPFDLLETLRLDNGRYVLLDEHLARLARSADALGFAFQARAVDAALAAVRQAHPHGRFRVRLLVAQDGAARTEAYALGASPAAPLRVGWADRPVTAADPDLGHKTTRRALYDAALAARPECDDVLLVNEHGQVTESCRANVVAAIAGRLVTPALSCGLLPGTYRQRLLRRGVIAEAVLTPDDLATAKRVWLVNSVRLWRPAVLDTPGPPLG